MPKKKAAKIDEQIEETFPASDPPSFMGGEVLGAPKGRSSTKAHKSAKKKAKIGPKTRVKFGPKKKIKAKKTSRR